VYPVRESSCGFGDGGSSTGAEIWAGGANLFREAMQARSPRASDKGFLSDPDQGTRHYARCRAGVHRVAHRAGNGMRASLAIDVRQFQWT